MKTHQQPLFFPDWTCSSSPRCFVSVKQVS